MKLTDITLVSEDGGLGGTSRLWRLSMLFTFLFLVIYIVGFSTDWWAELDNVNYSPISGAKIDAHFGLWRKCYTISINESRKIAEGCDDMDNDDAYKPVAKVLCSLGLILGIFGLPLALLAACGHSVKVMIFGASLTIFGGLVAAVGSIVYIGKAKDDEDRLDVHYSTILALIGSVFLTICGACQLLSVRTGYHTLA